MDSLALAIGYGVMIAGGLLLLTVAWWLTVEAIWKGVKFCYHIKDVYDALCIVHRNRRGNK